MIHLDSSSNKLTFLNTVDSKKLNENQLVLTLSLGSNDGNPIRGILCPIHNIP